MYISIIFLVLAYFVAFIPIGNWVSKLIWGIDLSKKGFRILDNLILFFTVFAVDFLKAYLLLYFAGQYATKMIIPAIAIILMIGNAASVFLKMGGGKGVATFMGILAHFSPYIALVFLISWVISYFSLRRAGISSLISCLIAIGLYFFIGDYYSTIMVMFVMALLIIVYKHMDDIKSLASEIFS